MRELVSYQEIRDKIIEVRGERVLLDRDVAELYGVETKHINQALRNNPDKFPEGFIITPIVHIKYLGFFSKLL